MQLYYEADAGIFFVILTCIQHFLYICVVVFFIFKILGQSKKIAQLPGIWFFAIFLVSSALYDLPHLFNYSYNRQMFAPLSDTLFTLRYLFSMALRISYIIVGFGLIRLKPWARLFVVYLGVFTIATIYWKHPFYVFENIAIMSEQQQSLAPVTELQYPAFPWISMFFYVTVDLVIAGLLVYYFTRQPVVDVFQDEIKNSQATHSS